LYKKYGNGFLAIRNNSFSVRKGEIFGLLGPNGAGKSTTFNIVTAAIPKTSGDVKILQQMVTNGVM
jgi:ABC-type multidrug transport system ATPase subunit